MGDTRHVLRFWDALVPKLRQLIREETRSAVRKKKMNIASVDRFSQTVTVYEAADPSVLVTLPYTSGLGIEKMTEGQSVMVEWTGNDFSTAVAAMPGRNWASIEARGGGGDTASLTFVSFEKTGTYDIGPFTLALTETLAGTAALGSVVTTIYPCRDIGTYTVSLSGEALDGAAAVSGVSLAWEDET